MSITLNDIAQHAGCSPATVSRALNGTAGVDKLLYARILSAAQTLESNTAQEKAEKRPKRGRPRGSLRKSDAVDVIIFRREPVEPMILSEGELTIAPVTDAAPNFFFSPRFRLTTDFYRHIIDGVVSILSSKSLKTIQQVRSDLLDEAFLHDLQMARHRGVLLLGEPGTAVKTFVAQCGRPTVLIDILGVPNQPVVAIDNVGGIRQSLGHLLELGHRDIGFAGQSENPSLFERYLAFCGGMSAAGLTVQSEWCYNGSGHICDVTAGTRGILARKRRPTAFLCATDYYAIGTLEAARSLGMALPRDLSVVGFDDIEVAALFSPPITTIRVPKIQLGACAADLLLRCTEDNGLAEAWHHCEVRCRTELCVRASTASISGAKNKTRPKR